MRFRGFGKQRIIFVDGFGGGVPKHLTTFVAHVKEFVWLDF